MELDFKNLNWSNALLNAIDETDIVLAADGICGEGLRIFSIITRCYFFVVIYDDDLTDGLIATIEKLLAPPAKRCIYIALEKRYVFTVADLESLAPCYEYFLSGIEKLRHRKGWSLVSIPIDFPQYFQYERVKELVLLKLSVWTVGLFFNIRMIFHSSLSSDLMTRNICFWPYFCKTTPNKANVLQKKKHTMLFYISFLYIW